jgi:hypothetical protein
MVVINSVGANDINAVTPMGRIVFGNPMIFAQDTDYDTKQPLVKNGQPVMTSRFGFAIPKQGEQHWAQTPWGALIYAEGSNAFPAMVTRPDFAWKIADGDSPQPNKAGIAWNSKEGYPGHWVLTLSTQLGAPKCFKHNTQFGTTTEVVTDKDIKPGDYGRITFTCADNRDKNGQARSPGVYLNPIAFCKDQDGTAIVSEGAVTVDAAKAFGGTVVAATPVQAQGAYTPAYQPPIQQQAATPAYAPPASVQPNNTWQNPPPPAGAVVTPPPAAPVVRMVSYNGQTVKADDLLAGGWTEAQITQHTTAV